ncbi:MAG TPA: isoprenylcysteine carboxylmethyltransferase family protein [Candidatus Bathyarchaeia archaeon]|nr:isoprenylcysteine carboxylmethyltransferase family protein [Candidatus Bathyarchaeia archaeon]
MSLVPEFELGLWNAWIFIVLQFLLNTIFPGLINKATMKKMDLLAPYRKPTPHHNTKKVLALATHAIIMPFTIFYSIFLPLKLGTVWFYVGLPICLLSLVMNLIASINIVTTPLDKLVTKGVYSISRNPIYFSAFLMYVGIGVACASWIFLLCGVAWIIIWHIAVKAEERFLLEKYGDTYREYMNRTPRWIGIPSSRKNK